jgi:Cd2+/Zn2+-exporting ATPase
MTLKIVTLNFHLPPSHFILPGMAKLQSPRCARRMLALLRSEPGVQSIELERATQNVKLGYADRVLTPERAQSVMRSASVMLAEELRQCPAGSIVDLCSACRTELRTEDPPTVFRQHIERRTVGIYRVECSHGLGLKWLTEKLPKFQQREIEHGEAHDPDEWKIMLISAAVCGVATLAGWFLQYSGYPPAAGVLFFIAYASGGWDAALDSWELLKERRIDVHFLMLLVAVGAAFVGKPLEGATLLFLFSLSGGLEHFAQGRTEKEISALLKAAPREATLVKEGREIRVLAEDLQPGDEILLRPGDYVPADASVVTGQGAVDESNITGESVPQEKSPGSLLFAGTLNQQGALTARVTKPAQESTLQKMLALIHEAQKAKAPSQRFTDWFSERYTWAVLGVVSVFAAVLIFGFRMEWNAAFYRTMTLLVVASPCALVLSIPSAILAAIAAGARRGILFKGGAALEQLNDIDVICVDKTGTLTTGVFRVQQVELVAGTWTEAQALQTAAAVEALSEHPLARAVVSAARAKNLEWVTATDFTATPGGGVRAKVGGTVIAAGTGKYVQSIFPQAVVHEIAGAGVSVIWLSDGTNTACLHLADEIRQGLEEPLRRMEKRHKQFVMLTGDHEGAAQRVAEALKIKTYFSRLKPEDKLQKIREFQKDKKHVAMVGDGVNDAPGLVAADIGIAMGARGSDAALEQADVILMNDRLDRLADAVDLSARTQTVIKQNLFISLGTVAVLVVCAMSGKLGLTIGVVGHEGSTVVVVMNSLRLLLKRVA